MLGPGIMFTVTPIALGISIHALLRSIDRPFAIAALCLSSAEALLLATVILLAVLA